TTVRQCLQRNVWVSQSAGMCRTFLQPGHVAWTTAVIARDLLPPTEETILSVRRAFILAGSRKHCITIAAVLTQRGFGGRGRGPPPALAPGVAEGKGSHHHPNPQTAAPHAPAGLPPSGQP